MEIIFAVTVLVIITFAVIAIMAIKKTAKIKDAMIAFKKELILSQNVTFFCKELSAIPTHSLKRLPVQENDIVDYLAYIVKDYLQLSHLLSEMDYYKLPPEVKQFVIDYLKKAWAHQSAAIIYAEIICSEVLSYPKKSNTEREKTFIMDNYKDSPDFQAAVIADLRKTKDSSLLKSFQVEWISQEIEKLQKQFTKKN
jgi:hypothetical protein